MTPSPTAWWDFGYAGIFGCVFLEQVGVPIPAFPALVAAGALIVSGELSLAGCLLTAVVAALLADLIWYGIGRVRGGAVLNLMCRMSWRPDSCVSKTKTAFVKHGTKTLLVSKFIPGLSTLAPPMSGMLQVPLARFVLFDGIGSLLWALGPLLAGLYLQHRLKTLEDGFASMKSYLPWGCGIIIVAVLAWRYFNRRRYLSSLQAALKRGIRPQELKSMLDQNRDVVIVDVRAEIDHGVKPLTLPHARLIPYTALPRRLSEIPLDKTIVTYCDCPKDQAAVAIADMLTNTGAKDAHPLLGGLEGWINRGFVTETIQAP